MTEPLSSPPKKTLPFFKNKEDYEFYHGDITTECPTTVENATSHFYVTYDPEDPPPHPGKDWTRFVCISDTHSRTDRDFVIPPGDVLIHAGDLSSWGHFPQLRKTLTWLQTFPHEYKVLIAGNHDLCLDEEWIEDGPMSAVAGNGIPLKEHKQSVDYILSEPIRDAGIRYIRDETLKLALSNGRTWEIYGSPNTPRYAYGAFQYLPGPKGGADKIYAKIPSTTEVLMTHTPPYGSCDLSKDGKHAGCPTLQQKLASSDLAACRLHAFGHIHEANGAQFEPSGRVSVNAAMFGQLAIIVDLKN